MKEMIFKTVFRLLFDEDCTIKKFMNCFLTGKSLLAQGLFSNVLGGDNLDNQSE